MSVVTKFHGMTKTGKIRPQIIVTMINLIKIKVLRGDRPALTIDSEEETYSNKRDSTRWLTMIEVATKIVTWMIQDRNHGTLGLLPIALIGKNRTNEIEKLMQQWDMNRKRMRGKWGLNGRMDSSIVQTTDGALKAVEKRLLQDIYKAPPYPNL